MKSNERRHVTDKQGMHLAKIARKNGVSRSDFQNFLENSKKVKQLSIRKKVNNDWFGKLQTSAKKIGACVYLIPKLNVDYTMPYASSIKIGGLKIKPTYDFIGQCNKYPIFERKIKFETVVLFRWTINNGSYEEAVKWGLSNGLRNTTPHVPFAIAEHFPGLNYKIGPNVMYVAETTGALIGGHLSVVYVFWNNIYSREANYCFGYKLTDPNAWLSFCK